MNIDKLKKQIAEIQNTLSYYEMSFMEDGTIDSEEQALMDKLKNSIEKINQKIAEISLKTSVSLNEKYRLCEQFYNTIKTSINDKSVLLKSINSFDSSSQSYFKIYSKSDLDTQVQAKEQKNHLNDWNTKVLLVKEEHLPPIKDLSRQKENPKIKPQTKKIATYKDVTKYQVDAILNLFKQGSPKSPDEFSKVHHNDVKQGDLNDCYFLTALAAVAKANPASIENLITPKKDGTYDVKLYIRKKKFLNPGGLNPIIINVTTDLPVSNRTDNPIYAKQGDDELWVSLVEKAYAKLNGTKINSSYKKTEWGYGYQGIEAITGHHASHFVPKKKTREDLIQTIQNALIEQRPITTGTKPNKKNRNNWKLSDNTELIPSHEYYILNINNRDIKLRNPHGNDSYVGGNILKITISDFTKYFDIVSLKT